jgi:MFS superfamily sulfate permease-like transporter
VVALALLFFTHPLRYLPKCVLSAIVFIVAVRLVDMRGMWAIRRESPGEYWLATMTAALVVLVGAEQGILLAMVLSLLRIVAHSYRSHTAVLIEVPGLWQLIPAVPGTQTEPGLIVYRFGAPSSMPTLAVFPTKSARWQKHRASHCAGWSWTPERSPESITPPRASSGNCSRISKREAWRWYSLLCNPI